MNQEQIKEITEKEKIVLTDDDFWKENPILSYGRLFSAFYAGRGTGKTFRIKKRFMNRYMKKQSESLWVRRYASSFENFTRFLVDVKIENPGVYDRFVLKDGKFPIVGYIPDGYDPGDDKNMKHMERAIETAALSTLSRKGTNYPTIDEIMFDEFLADPQKERYLPDEYGALMSAHEGISRLRDVRWLLAANNTCFYNPYFLTLEYLSDDLKRFWVPKDKFGPRSMWAIEKVPDNQKIIEAKLQTDFGRGIVGTTYGDHSIFNKSLADNENFMAKKTRFANAFLNIRVDGKLYGIWFDAHKPAMYVSKNVCDKQYYTFTFSNADHQTDSVQVKVIKQNYIWKEIIQQYGFGNMYYEHNDCKHAMLKALKISAGVI